MRVWAPVRTASRILAGGVFSSRAAIFSPGTMQSRTCLLDRRKTFCTKSAWSASRTPASSVSSMSRISSSMEWAAGRLDRVGALHAAADQLFHARLADGHQRELGGHEQPIQCDQSRDGEQAQSDPQIGTAVFDRGKHVGPRKEWASGRYSMLP